MTDTVYGGRFCIYFDCPVYREWICTDNGRQNQAPKNLGGHVCAWSE